MTHDVDERRTAEAAGAANAAHAASGGPGARRRAAGSRPGGGTAGPRRKRIRAATAVLLTGGLAAATGGCASPFGTPDTGWRSQADDLATIATEQPRRWATEEPESVEDGVRRLDRRLEAERFADDPAEGPARPVEAISLADVRAAALEHNLDLRVERVNPSTALERVREEAAAFEAVFDGSVRWSRTDQPVALATESAQAETFAAEVGLSVPLNTGGSIALALPVSEQEVDNPFSLLNPAVNADARFTISHPLLRNAGQDVTTFSLRVAQLEADRTAALSRLEAIRVLAAADRAYWAHYAARRNLEVTVQQLELARAQAERAARRVRAGDAAEVEILRAESGVAERVEAVIVADNQLRRTRRELKRIMGLPGLPLEGDTRIDPATEPAPVGLELDRRRLVQLALERRMEMLELELQLAIDQRTIDLRRNQRLPLLTLDYTYNVSGLGGSYADAFDQLPPRTFDDWTVGLTAQVPIGNEAAESRFRQALLTRVQRLATKEQRVVAIRQEVLDAADTLRESWLRILAARREVLAASRTLEAEQRQFEVGARTSTDVLDAQSQLAVAQFREIQAVTDYEIAQVDLAFATGSLLGLGQVDWVTPDPGRGRILPVRSG